MGKLENSRHGYFGNKLSQLLIYSIKSRKVKILLMELFVEFLGKKHQSLKRIEFHS